MQAEFWKCSVCKRFVIRCRLVAQVRMPVREGVATAPVLQAGPVEQQTRAAVRLRVLSEEASGAVASWLAGWPSRPVGRPVRHTGG